jgi:hypothetical protein
MKALSTIPALIYTFIERGVFRMNTTILGARYGAQVSMYGHQFLICNAVYGYSRCWQWRRSKHIKQIPISCLATQRYRLGRPLWCWYCSFLSWCQTPVSWGTSAAFFLDMDVSDILFLSSKDGRTNGFRGPGISQIPSAAREDSPMDRRQDEFARETSTLRFRGPEDIWTIWSSSHHDPDDFGN